VVESAAEDRDRGQVTHNRIESSPSRPQGRAKSPHPTFILPLQFRIGTYVFFLCLEKIRTNLLTKNVFEQITIDEKDMYDYSFLMDEISFRQKCHHEKIAPLIL
jgi:hypothetical protein